MCPVYTLIFWSDGTAVYRGERFVDKVGTFYGTANIAIIGAWLDSQHVDQFAGSYGMDWIDAEALNLTIEHTGGNRTSIATLNTEYLPWQVQGTIAGIDGFGDRVRWKDVSTLGPAMGYFYYEDGDKVFDQIDVYPGGGPRLIEAAIENGTAGTNGRDTTFSTWEGRATLSRTNQPDSYEGNAFDAYSLEPTRSPLRIVAKDGGLTVTMDGETHVFTRGSASLIQDLTSKFYSRTFAHPQPKPADPNPSTAASPADASKRCFDKATTQSAMDVCASEDARNADVELARAYQRALARVSGDAAATHKVVAAERAWVAYRDSYLSAMFPAEDKQTSYGSAYPMQADELRAALTYKQVEAMTCLALGSGHLYASTTEGANPGTTSSESASCNSWLGR